MLLEKPEPKPGVITRRTVVIELAEQLKRGLALGYTHKQLAEWMTNNGVSISAVTLGQYMRDLGIGKKRMASRKRKGVPKASVEPAVSVDVTALKAVVATEPVTAARQSAQNKKPAEESLSTNSGRAASPQIEKKSTAASRPAPSGDGDSAAAKPPQRSGPVPTSGSFIPRGDTDEI